MSGPTNKLSYSVLIPLEFHRGIGLKCVRGWTNEQNCLPSCFEVILIAPEDFPAEEREAMQSLLRDNDRIITLPAHHDMDLVAEGARQARGENLVFTESHCLPEPDFLSCCSSVFEKRPEWSAFSGRSVPITHNLLSEVEAEMYAADIESHLQHHPWLKVLDQCFVIKRKAYEQIGGLEPEYGHYAEWVLAARLKEANLEVGYSEEVAVKHYYSGDLDDLSEFAQDFGAGEFRYFHCRSNSSPDHGLHTPAVWENRAAWRRVHVWRVLQMMRRMAHLAPQRINAEWKRRRAVWVKRLVGGLSREIRSVKKERASFRESLESALSAGDRQAAKIAYHAFNEHSHLLGQLLAFRQLRSESHLVESHGAALSKLNTRWSPIERNGAELIGFESSSTIDGVRFIWSAPEAAIWIPADVGQYEVTLRWLNLLPLNNKNRIQFFIDGRPVPARNVLLSDGEAIIQVNVENRHGLYFGWVAEPLTSPDDRRALGLPITSVTWHREKQTDRLPITTKKRPVYFLHIMKTMGTTARHAIENAFPAADIFAPTNDCYLVRELPHHSESLKKRRLLYRGHFGWDLMSHTQPSTWRIVTLLREPKERLLSLFDYQKSLRRIPPERTVEDWLKNDLLLNHMMGGLLTPCLSQLNLKGLDALTNHLAIHIDEAMENLRSCSVVTIQEEPETSLLMLCHAVGAWPPDLSQRVNPTKRKTIQSELSPIQNEFLNRITETEATLYAEGVRLFRIHQKRMLDELGVPENAPDSLEKARAELRRRVRVKMEPSLLRKSSWRPRDIYLGDNLHSREFHGKWLRWTGPEPTTKFTWYLDVNQNYRLQIRLHSPTPLEHAKNANLRVNGLEVPLQLELDESQMVSGLLAQIGSKTLRKGKGAWHNFELYSPVGTIYEDIRTLGLCVLGFDFTATT